jgi:ribulose-phosphate 3-epimerase
MVKLGIAIYNGNHCKLFEEIERCEQAGADFIHWDVSDGYFIPDLAFSPQTIKTARQYTAIPFHVHLGVLKPHEFIPSLIDAGVNLIHLPYESCMLPYEMIFDVKKYAIQVGFSLSLGTYIENLEPILPFCDSILLLTRVQRQTKREPIQVSSLARIKVLKKLINKCNKQIAIGVGGGMTAKQIEEAVHYGADEIVFGSSFYKSNDPISYLHNQRVLIKKVINGGTVLDEG